MSRFLHPIWTTILVGIAGGQAAAQPTANAIDRDSLVRAEELYKADKLFESEKLFLKMVNSPAAEDRRKSYDRLSAIYTRVGRPDSAIQLFEKYQAWLDEIGDAERSREIDVEFGGSYLILGHYREAEKHLVKALREQRGLASLQAMKKIIALTYLAQASDKLGKKDQTKTSWEGVESAALGELKNNPNLSRQPGLQIDIVYKLVESYRYQGKYQPAVDRLLELLPRHEELKDTAGKRDTLRSIAEFQSRQRKWTEASKSLLAALTEDDRLKKTERLTHGHLAFELSSAYEKAGSKAEAAKWRDVAIADLQQVLKNAEAGQKEVAGAVAAFWRLQELYQSVNQFRKALNLSEEQSETWTNGSLIDPRLKSEQGGLQTLLGSYAQARTRLRESVAALEKQRPLNLLELPRTCNNLALVELATDGSDRALELGNRVLYLYRTYGLPDDMVLTETYNLLGSAAAQLGRYREAVDRFREGIALCEKLGPIADSTLGNLHLNIALLMKAQGEYTEAIRSCSLAREIQSRLPNADDLTKAAIEAALADLYTVTGRIHDAAALADHILQVCARNNVERGPLIVTARHCKALDLLASNKIDEAELLWVRLRKAQEDEKQQLLLPRTLNYLALAAELRDDTKAALELYQRASALQENNPRAFPVTRFITLWRFAVLLDQKGEKAAAKKNLDRAVDIAESTRLNVFGESQQRSAFFSQFAIAFEKQIEWAVRDGDFEAAFKACCRGRSRVLLDQLQMANVDPRRGLEGTKSEANLLRERQLLEKISALRAKAQLIPSEAMAGEQSQNLLKEFDAAQEEYAGVWREILNASPVYRDLADRKGNDDSLETIRKRILNPETGLLVYHIGRERSVALWLTDKVETSKAYPLQIAKSLADSAGQMDSYPYSEGLRGTKRDLVFRARPKSVEPTPEKKEVANSPLLPLNDPLARSAVDHYWERVSESGFDVKRGLVFRPKQEKQAPVVQRTDLLGDVFLPPELRKAIRDSKVKHLIVIPDGPLHKLPIEALVIDADNVPRYAMDELPPISYFPSAAILARSIPDARWLPDPTTASLLTLSNPAYPQNSGGVDPDPEQKRTGKEHILTLLSNIPILKDSAIESERIAKTFDSRLVTTLSGTGATEEAFSRAVGGKSVVHVAAHGFADERSGNRFGALVLCPPKLDGEVLPGNDGFLSLYEIYRLPLQDCQLAVLSACVTNVGPQQPLEAGATIANAFLGAGAKRVVASHWSVDDRSTAALMDAFFQEIANAGKTKQPLHLDEALQNARKKVRAMKGFEEPCYWAPFTLIGPGW